MREEIPVARLPQTDYGVTMFGTKPEFQKYENALNVVNKKLDQRLDELDQICRGRMSNRGATGPLATAPFLSELGWIHYVNRALDHLEEAENELEKLRVDGTQKLAARLFQNGFPAESMDVDS